MNETCLSKANVICLSCSSLVKVVSSKHLLLFSQIIIITLMRMIMKKGFLKSRESPRKKRRDHDKIIGLKE